MAKIRNLNKKIETCHGEPMTFSSDTMSVPLTNKIMLCEILSERVWNKMGKISSGRPTPIFGTLHNQVEAVRKIRSAKDEVELQGVSNDDVIAIVEQGCKPFMADQIIESSLRTD